MITMRHNQLKLNENEVIVETREDMLKTAVSVLSTLNTVFDGDDEKKAFVCGKFHCFLLNSLGQTSGLRESMCILFILYAQKDAELML